MGGAAEGPEEITPGSGEECVIKELIKEAEEALDQVHPPEVEDEQGDGAEKEQQELVVRLQNIINRLIQYTESVRQHIQNQQQLCELVADVKAQGYNPPGLPTPPAPITVTQEGQILTPPTPAQTQTPQQPAGTCTCQTPEADQLRRSSRLAEKQGTGEQTAQKGKKRAADGEEGNKAKKKRKTKKGSGKTRQKKAGKKRTRTYHAGKRAKKTQNGGYAGNTQGNGHRPRTRSHARGNMRDEEDDDTEDSGADVSGDDWHVRKLGSKQAGDSVAAYDLILAGLEQEARQFAHYDELIGYGAVFFMLRLNVWHIFRHMQIYYFDTNPQK